MKYSRENYPANRTGSIEIHFPDSFKKAIFSLSFSSCYRNFHRNCINDQRRTLGCILKPSMQNYLTVQNHQNLFSQTQVINNRNILFICISHVYTSFIATFIKIDWLVSKANSIVGLSSQPTQL